MQTGTEAHQQREDGHDQPHITHSSSSPVASPSSPRIPKDNVHIPPTSPKVPHTRKKSRDTQYLHYSSYSPPASPRHGSISLSPSSSSSSIMNRPDRSATSYQFPSSPSLFPYSSSSTSVTSSSSSTSTSPVVAKSDPDKLHSSTSALHSSTRSASPPILRSTSADEKDDEHSAASEEEDVLSTDNFEKIQLVGQGDVGKVYLVRQRNSETLYAMKVLNKKELIRRNKVKRVLTEREILSKANHPFIVTLHYCFQTPESCVFILDYCAGGEFFRTLQRQPNKSISEDAARFYAAEVLLALEYLHMMGFVYRDLKPENILLHESGHIMLTDFDLSKKANQAGPQPASQVKKSFGGKMQFIAKPRLLTNSFVGTEEYLAPEVIEGSGHSCSVDWWTFGILIFEMLYGSTPFRGASRDQTFAHIILGGLKFPDHPVVSNDCKSLLKKLLNPDPKKRLGAENGAADVKQHRFFKAINWSFAIRNPPSNQK